MLNANWLYLYLVKIKTLAYFLLISLFCSLNEVKEAALQRNVGENAN